MFLRFGVFEYENSANLRESTDQLKIYLKKNVLTDSGGRLPSQSASLVFTKVEKYN